MTGPGRDWDKELAAIDRVIAKAPPQPAGQPALRPGAAVAAAPAGRAAAFFTWLRVVLGIVLAAAMTQWPYPHACGLNLFAYLGAVGVVVVAGIWSAVSSWYRRLSWAHTLSLLVTLWGLGLGAAIVLPRIGYARSAALWLCP